jgi:hypothetical protein
MSREDYNRDYWLDFLTSNLKYWTDKNKEEPHPWEFVGKINRYLSGIPDLTIDELRVLMNISVYHQNQKFRNEELQKWYSKTEFKGIIGVCKFKTFVFLNERGYVEVMFADTALD